MIEGALERAVTLRVCDSSGEPELMPVSATTCGPAFSGMAMLGIGAKVGGLFCPFTAGISHKPTHVLIDRINRLLDVVLIRHTVSIGHTDSKCALGTGL